MSRGTPRDAGEAPRWRACAPLASAAGRRAPRPVAGLADDRASSKVLREGGDGRVTPAADEAMAEGARGGRERGVARPSARAYRRRREARAKRASARDVRVLVHHGVGRARSAARPARYDVVLTTFAVVALETNPAADARRRRGRARAARRRGTKGRAARARGALRDVAPSPPDEPRRA